MLASIGAELIEALGLMDSFGLIVLASVFITINDTASLIKCKRKINKSEKNSHNPRYKPRNKYKQK